MSAGASGEGSYGRSRAVVAHSPQPENRGLGLGFRDLRFQLRVWGTPARRVPGLLHGGAGRTCSPPLHKRIHAHEGDGSMWRFDLSIVVCSRNHATAAGHRRTPEPSQQPAGSPQMRPLAWCGEKRVAAASCRRPIAPGPSHPAAAWALARSRSSSPRGLRTLGPPQPSPGWPARPHLGD